MKKKLSMTVSGVFMIFTVLSFNVSQNLSADVTLKNIKIMSQAKASELCPTGCVEGSGGCYCNGMSSECWQPPKSSELMNQL